MEYKTVKRNSFSSLERSGGVTNNMLQKEARELYEVAECIPGREWAEWFTAQRLSRARRKT